MISNADSPAFPQPYPPQAFEKAIVFIDGSNLLNRLHDEKIKINDFYKIAVTACGARQVLRVYFYTSEDKLSKAKEVHGVNAFDNCRVVLGHSVLRGNGAIKEKGVDALLVADLVYHAATKNCQYAVIFSNDTDFVFAIKRVEDFGCKTAIVSTFQSASDRLVNACDDYYHITKDSIIERNWGNEI